MVIYGWKCRIKAVELVKKSNFNKKVLRNYFKSIQLLITIKDKIKKG
jgi:hypothetical protein